MGRSTAFALVGAAAAIGAAIRLAVNRGLSLDEIRNLDQAHQPFGQLIVGLIHTGVHPPLYPVLEWCVIRLLGDTNFAVRLPSLVAGVALIPAAAWLAVELFDRRTGVVVALLTAVAPVLVWYSQEASNYILVALFGTLAVLGATRAIRRGAPMDWGLHVFGCALAVWSGWSGLLIVLATEVTLLGVLVHRRRTGVPVAPFLKGWAIDSLALACQLVPLILLLVSQLHGNGGLSGVAGVASSGVSFYSAVSNISWGLFGFHPGTVTGVLSALWPLVMLACLLLIGRELGRRGWLLIVCALIPAIGVFALGLAAPTSFDVRYAIVSVPLILVLLARVVTGWSRSRAGRVLVAAGMLIVLVGALIDQQVNANNPRRYDYQRAYAQVQRDASPGSAVYYAPAGLSIVQGHFAPGLNGSKLTTRLPTRAQSRSVFVITSFSNQPALKALLNRDIGALRATRHLVSHRHYPGITVWWFR